MIIMKKCTSIKVAIHDSPGSFSDRWIEYCEEKFIPYRRISCYDSNIIDQLKSFDVLLWHWHHEDAKAILFARQLLMSAGNMGIKVFPNINSCWHFDDKIGQKYMMESINAPLVPSYVLYDKQEAIDWIEKTNFPKVFKLRCGAGSHNVSLVRDRIEAKKLCKTSFGKGFKVITGYFSDFSANLRKAANKGNYSEKIRRLPAALFKIYIKNKMRGRDKGYLYFQDFIADNEFDTRVTIVGNRAFAFRRMVRKNDFRASGSGNIDYDRTKINMKCVTIAFDIAQRLQSQSMAFDFVEAEGSNPLIVEVSYCYVPTVVHACRGHWDRELVWHDGAVWPQDAILDDIIMSLGQ